MRRYVLVLLLLSFACGFETGVDGDFIEGKVDDVGEGPDAGPADEPEPEPEPQPEPTPVPPTPTPACADTDGDGFDGQTPGCPGGSDCDDDDANAFPGQTGFFDVARANGSFDYDCDGSEDLLHTDTYGGVLGDACDSYEDDDGINSVGWQSNLVDCGATGTYLYCDGEDLRSEMRVQACR